MGVVFTNNATSILAASITSGQTTLTVQTGDGVKFPSPTGGDWCPITLVQGTTLEIVRCTARSGDVLTVTRGQEGTTALAFNAGAQCDHRLTRAALVTFTQEAPVDTKTYGRKDASWVESVTKTYVDTGLGGKLNTGVPIPGASFDDTSHGNRAGGSLHPLATSSVAGFFLEAASDGKQYARVNGAWVEVVAALVIADTAPSSPRQGAMWWESDSGGLFIWYNDGNTSQWVQVNTVQAGTFVSEAPIDGTIYARKDAGWVPSPPFPEAPINGQQYARQDAAWAAVVIPPSTYIGDAPPSSPIAGQLWWESDTGSTFIYYNDGNTSQWVPAVSNVGPQGPAGTPGAPGAAPWVQMTQAAYDALAVKDPGTLYVIVG